MLITIQAKQPGRQAFEMQFGSIGNRALGDNIPIELNRIIHDAGKLPNDKVKVGDALRLGLFGMTEGKFQDALGYG